MADIGMDELRTLSAWMRDSGVTEVNLPSGLRIVMPAAGPAPADIRMTLEEQQAFERVRKDYETRIQFAHVEGLP